MPLDWNQDLAVGHPLIDTQHQELIQRFNDLLESCRRGQGKSQVGRLFEFLDDYVLFHFTEEEQLMIRHGYPEREGHMQQHREFKTRLADLRNSLRQEGANTPLVVSANQVLLDWIIRHIKQVDVRFGRYLETQS